MHRLSIALASLFLVACSLAPLLMLFAAWFPYENLSAAELAEDDWLAPAAALFVALAIAMLVAVVQRRFLWVAMSFVGAAAVGLVVLRFALLEISDSSDAEVTWFAVAIGVVGVSALLASSADAEDGRSGP